MKKFFIIVFCVLIISTLGLSAQDDTLGSKRVYHFVEQMPEYPGGEEQLTVFLSKNIKYPKAARKNNIEGRVIVQFIVLANGNLTNLEVKKEIGGDCGKEVLRVLKLMPPWKAGMQNGKTVSVQYVLPVKFELEKSKKQPAPRVQKPLSNYLNYQRSKLVQKHLGVH